jgi:hypothetical protein
MPQAQTIEVDAERLPARATLLAAIDEAWSRLAGPGTWWTGAERIAIAAEARAAASCRLCRTRKAALSPYTSGGAHEAVTDLPLDAIEAAHRLRTDAGRLTRRWVEDRAHCLGEERYVELVSVVAIVTALDTFDLALGRPAHVLPEARTGAPSCLRPAGAARDLAWVATLAPDKAGPGDVNPYPVHGDKNIHRALSLVPQEVLNFFDLDVELYLKDHEIRDFATEHRAITHAQIELVAARASAINQCFY